MLFNDDYSKMTMDELMSEEQKLKSNSIATIFFNGMLIGIAFWSAIEGGLVFTVGLLGLAVFIGYSLSQKKKAVQAEISRRETTR